MTKVAVVTGSNKGIGFAIVKGLFGKFDGDIILTSRSEERGLAAIEELKKVLKNILYNKSVHLTAKIRVQTMIKLPN
jgi:NAD(P)-dependent dehydrogenase (short-subunit alcohol dehydrogenase family)